MSIAGAVMTEYVRAFESVYLSTMRLCQLTHAETRVKRATPPAPLVSVVANTMVRDDSDHFNTLVEIESSPSVRSDEENVNRV